MTIKAIIFDLFGVLYKDRWKEFLYINANNLIEFLQIDKVLYIDDLDFPRKYPDYYNKLIKYNTDPSIKENKISDEDFYSVLSKASKLDSKIIREMIHDTSVLNKHVIKTIQHFKNKNYITGIITNGDRSITNEFLKANNIEYLFDQIVTSEECGILKPSRLIYQSMLGKLNIQPQEMIFIDDSPTNTKGARNLGIYTIDYIDQSKDELLKEIDDIINE